MSVQVIGLNSKSGVRLLSIVEVDEDGEEYVLGFLVVNAYGEVEFFAADKKEDAEVCFNQQSSPSSSFNPSN